MIRTTPRRHSISRNLSLAGLISLNLAYATVADTIPASNSISAALQPFVDRRERAGAVVLVADREKILAIEAVGSADLEDGKAMPPNALFWIASQSKPITATALLMLVDEGKVTLDDPVSKYIPEFQDV